MEEAGDIQYVAGAAALYDREHVPEKVVENKSGHNIYSREASRLTARPKSVITGS